MAKDNNQDCKDKKKENLHNDMFLACFSDPEAASLLFSEHLPPSLTRLFSPGPPELVPGSFIDDELAEHRTDLLYRLRLKSGGRAYVYVLVEHKSAPDPLTPLQLLRYLVNIWSQSPDGKKSDGKKTGSKARLPLTPIVPLVFYHGVSRWTVAPRFHGLFGELDPALRPLTCDFVYALIDLGRIDDERLSRNLRQRAHLAALKYNPRSDMRQAGLALVASLFGSLTEVEIYRLLRYILCQHSDITGDDLSRVLLEYEPERKDRIMHPLFQEHFDRGKAEGKAEGEAKGEAKGKAETLLKLLSRRFGRPPADIEQRVRGADAETLDRWILRVLDAASVSEVFDN